MSDDSTKLLIENANEALEDEKVTNNSGDKLFFGGENLSNDVHNV